MRQTDDVDIAERRVVGSTREQFLKRAGGVGLAVGAGGLLAACDDDDAGGGVDTITNASGPEMLRRGGNLRIGMGSGSAADTLDPFKATSTADAARSYSLYDGLADVRGSRGALEPKLALAEEISPNEDGTVWTIRLREGVEFHNGKTLDVDDFIATYERMTDPKVGAFGVVRWSVYDMKAAKKLDKRTIRVPMTRPTGILPELMAAPLAGIIPPDFDVKNPVGTGPFKLKSFTPGSETVLERFENYWGESANADTVTLTSLPDDNSRYNALISGQIDVLDSIPLAQVETLKANAKFKVSSLPTAQYLPIYVRVDRPPFDDVRVRQALRLLVDRQQVVDTAFHGNATVGNDVFAKFDPLQDESLEREQDLEKAKSLLRQAGQEGLTATLVSAPVGTGAVETSQIFARNAESAGVNINLRQVDPGTMFGPNYLKWPFAIDNWPGLTYLVAVASATLSTAFVNESHFSNKEYDSLYQQAVGELDEAKRRELSHELQRIDFEQGGIIIAAHQNYTAAYATEVGGFYPTNRTGDTVAAGYLNRLGFVA
jgi:peptide/nickel transport system substrate-binding protein